MAAKRVCISLRSESDLVAVAIGVCVSGAAKIEASPIGKHNIAGVRLKDAACVQRPKRRVRAGRGREATAKTMDVAIRGDNTGKPSV